MRLVSTYHEDHEYLLSVILNPRQIRKNICLSDFHTEYYFGTQNTDGHRFFAYACLSNNIKITDHTNLTETCC